MKIALITFSVSVVVAKSRENQTSILNSRRDANVANDGDDALCVYPGTCQPPDGYNYIGGRVYAEPRDQVSIDRVLLWKLANEEVRIRRELF